MDSFWQAALVLAGINFAIVIAAVLVLWLVSIRLRDVSIIDMFFASILFVVAAVSFLLGEGYVTRRWLLLILTGIWAVRITLHLVRRNWGHGEDPRYTKLRNWVDDDRSFAWLSLRIVFLLQGVVIWFVSLPLQIGMLHTTPESIGWIGWAGVALWLVGFLFESVADRQLGAFRADPANKGRVLQTGLWKYSRHPNYFGELCVWWGIFLIACDNPIGILTIIGPILYTHLIVNVTGQRTLDKKLALERPGYKDYMNTTSGLIPMPPKSSASRS